MALIEKDVIVTTRYGRMPAFTACPDAAGAFPGIIFYMDAPGFREELCNMARRIAKHGYFCILPDMYYRMGLLRFDIPRRSDAMTAAIYGAMNSLTNADVVDDTAGLIAYLDAQDKVRPGPVGCVGHCMSGRYITTVAARFPTRIAAAASLYGVGIVTDAADSPHLLLDKIAGELYYGFAEVDPHVPDKDIPALRKALAQTRTRHEIEIHAGTQHGFCFPERQTYAPVASEAAWAKVFSLWERNLR
ncbi:MAG: dienelactone hydrolase family protein [Burkholderiales bacterium]|nr:dienelactone hydrolase family protein [Burkholderiales bacterium]